MSFDVAFGWQTTLSLSAHHIHQIVEVLSFPWNWIKNISPSIEEIKGSQLILKEGIYHLSNKDLASWWPFIWSCIFTYALLPRLGLLIYSDFKLNKYFKTLSFSASRFRQLNHRMASPLVDAHASQESQHIEETRDLQVTSKIHQPLNSNSSGTLIVSSEVLKFLDKERFTNEIINQYQSKIVEIISSELGQSLLLEKINEKQSSKNTDNIFLMVESWQPPLQEDIANLKAICKHHIHKNLYLLLVGKPTLEGNFSSIKDLDIHIWKTKLKSIKDKVVIEGFTIK